MRSRDSSVGIVTGCGLDDRGLIPGRGKRFFCTASKAALGPPSLLSNGYRGLFRRGLKRTGREANHSPSFSANVKNGGATSPFPHSSAWCGVKLIKYSIFYLLSCI
jgi:hypothetical protein